MEEKTTVHSRRSLFPQRRAAMRCRGGLPHHRIRRLCTCKSCCRWRARKAAVAKLAVMREAVRAHWIRLQAEQEVMQMRAVLYWCRILYALLSLPFFIFMLPFFDVALTRARPTGYDKNGKCVRMLSSAEQMTKHHGQKKAEAAAQEKAKRTRLRRLSSKYGDDLHGGTPITREGAESLEMV